MNQRMLLIQLHLFFFVIKQSFNLARYAENHVWLQSLAYLADIFSRINELNLSLQCFDMCFQCARQN
jgi:hypothetical protein